MAVKYATVVLKSSLCALSGRSRDNLPNPVQDDDNTYVPRNMPGDSHPPAPRKWAAGVRALYGTRPADSP
jgi:hypothetical protein